MSKCKCGHNRQSHHFKPCIGNMFTCTCNYFEPILEDDGRYRSGRVVAREEILARRLSLR